MNVLSEADRSIWLVKVCPFRSVDLLQILALQCCQLSEPLVFVHIFFFIRVQLSPVSLTAPPITPTVEPNGVSLFDSLILRFTWLSTISLRVWRENAMTKSNYIMIWRHCIECGQSRGQSDCGWRRKSDKSDQTENDTLRLIADCAIVAR
jgi:hypothetical protein